MAKKKHGKFVILPYNMLSKGASELATSLGALRVRENGYFQPKKPYIIVNWGNPRKPNWSSMVSGPDARRFMAGGGKVVNHWSNVDRAIDKLESLQKMAEGRVLIPEFTANINVARGWMNSDKKLKVVCRTLLRASEGRGIVVAKTADELKTAPLYTKFFVKKDEYRVHVFNGKVIDIQQKRLRTGSLEQEDRSQYIRNSANGWVFCREDVDCPERVMEEAIKSVDALSLQFGAVDIAVSKDGIPCVFEVNTAPGLEGTTITKYAEAFKSFYA